MNYQRFNKCLQNLFYISVILYIGYYSIINFNVQKNKQKLFNKRINAVIAKSKQKQKKYEKQIKALEQKLEVEHKQHLNKEFKLREVIGEQCTKIYRLKLQIIALTPSK